MPYYNAQDQGMFAPGQVLAEAVRQSIAAKQQQELLARQKAENAPITDPDVVRQQVMMAQAKARTGAGDAQMMGTLPFWARKSAEAGKMPGQSTTTSRIGPSGETVTEDVNSLPGNPGSPQSNLYTPYSGSQSVAHPPPRTVATVVPPPAGQKETPGISMVRTDSYYLKDPAKPDTDDNRQVIGSTTAAQRTSSLRGTAALAEMLGDPSLTEEQRQAIQGAMNKLSATAPMDPNKPKGNPSETERITDRITALNKQIADSDDDAEKTSLTAARDRLTARVGVLTQPKQQKETFEQKLDALSKMGQPAAATDPTTATAGNGQPKGSQMPPAPAAKVAAAKAAQPPAAPSGGLPSPQSPARPAASAAGGDKIPAKNTGNWVKGKTYPDAKGNKALWDGDGWIPQ